MKYHEVKVSGRDYITRTDDGYLVVTCDNLHQFNIGDAVVLRSESTFYSGYTDYRTGELKDEYITFCPPKNDKTGEILDIKPDFLPTKVALLLRLMPENEVREREEMEKNEQY
ncbi:hypothetical protein [Yersinia pekkanenii]|uniref:Uncharacterized protein n=1 Tax=Yersinia pekkanenii TaxID=1288385 RepID=A0A0T9QHP2_9GAMM|nr:hypothetical protein [Yersinia pekkanenii]CNI11872.1 Uncharacterised protein [Yersinia pekkanenii]CRY69221.1 Uncharacterised protein [Yersinia pekkanenii]